MTRLTHADIDGLVAALEHYDRHLHAACGCNLLELACRAAGLSPERPVRQQIAGIRAAVVPITAGAGIIGDFSHTVAGILRHIGFDAQAAAAPDVAGFAEAFAWNADLIFASDDLQFAAFIPFCRGVIDNGQATGTGFAAALEAMAGGLADQSVLVIGCGPVGTAAARYAAERGAAVTLHDQDARKARDLATRLQERGFTPSRAAADLKTALGENRCIIEATTSPGVIDPDRLRPDARIAAPGVPLGLPADAADRLGGQLVHDPLQIGVAVMACQGARLLQAAQAR